MYCLTFLLHHKFRAKKDASTQNCCQGYKYVHIRSRIKVAEVFHNVSMCFTVPYFLLSRHVTTLSALSAFHTTKVARSSCSLLAVTHGDWNEDSTDFKRPFQTKWLLYNRQSVRQHISYARHERTQQLFKSLQQDCIFNAWISHMILVDIIGFNMINGFSSQ